MVQVYLNFLGRTAAFGAVYLFGFLALVIFAAFLAHKWWMFRGKGPHPEWHSAYAATAHERESPAVRMRHRCLEMPAVAISARITAGDWKSRDVVETFIRQIEHVNKHINAVCSRRFSTARIEASFCDRCDLKGVYPRGGLANNAIEWLQHVEVPSREEIAPLEKNSRLSRSESLSSLQQYYSEYEYDSGDDDAPLPSPRISGALEVQWTTKRPRFWGVPCSVKECIGLKGMPQTSGLLSRKGITSEEDAPSVRRMRAHGLVVLVNTNTSELCMWYESDNKVYGRTKNAYHPGRIVGGSSGGEGTLLSAAGAPVGIGSDVGGSIRMPAHFNGIYGHKPSGGVIPATGQYPYMPSPMLSSGPMCRYAADLWPMFQMMAGPVNGTQHDSVVEELFPEIINRHYKCKPFAQLFSATDDTSQSETEKQTLRARRGYHSMTLCEAAASRLLECDQTPCDEEEKESLWKIMQQEAQQTYTLDTSPLLPILRKQLRVFTVHDLPNILPAISTTPEPYIMECVDAVVQGLHKTIGISQPPQEIELTELKNGFDIWSALMASGPSKPFRELLEDGRPIQNIIVEFFKALFGFGSFTVTAVGLAAIEELPDRFAPKHTAKMRELGLQVRERLEKTLGSSGVLIVPVHPSVAPPHNVPLLRIHNIVLTAFFNAMHVPSTVVPVGLDRDGIPACVQIIGAPGEDALTIAVATALEQHCGNVYATRSWNSVEKAHDMRLAKHPSISINNPNATSTGAISSTTSDDGNETKVSTEPTSLTTMRIPKRKAVTWSEFPAGHTPMGMKTPGTPDVEHHLVGRMTMGWIPPAIAL